MLLKEIIINSFTPRVSYGDIILWCCHSNEISLAVLLHGIIHFSTFYKIKFGISLEFWFWLVLFGVKRLLNISFSFSIIKPCAVPENIHTPPTGYGFGPPPHILWFQQAFTASPPPPQHPIPQNSQWPSMGEVRKFSRAKHYIGQTLKNQEIKNRDRWIIKLISQYLHHLLHDLLKLLLPAFLDWHTDH